MAFKKQNQTGFTIIELLIVVVVIGILATIVFTTFSGVRRNDRNKSRNEDINAIHNQLEYYYGQNSKYPTLAELNDATWRAANLKGLDQERFRDPRGSDTVLVENPGTGIYAYVVTPAGCNNAGTDCTGYTLTATYEGEGSYIKNNL